MKIDFMKFDPLNVIYIRERERLPLFNRGTGHTVTIYQSKFEWHELRTLCVYQNCDPENYVYSEFGIRNPLVFQRYEISMKNCHSAEQHIYFMHCERNSFQVNV